MPLKIAAFTAALLSASVSSSFGQAGHIGGRVLDQTGSLLPGVTIDLVVQGTKLTATSDNEGRYQFDSVPAGTGEITSRLLNFSVVRRMLNTAGSNATVPDTVLGLALNADVVVTGTSTFRNIAEIESPAENLVGIAAAASQGAVTAAQLDTRPVIRAGEVLESVPGMIISQHSGEGKANQYYLRGFNLDHGTDFATTVAGVPVNTPTGAHAHGYADVNFLIPELVSGVQYKKGPYFADEGTSQLRVPRTSITSIGSSVRNFDSVAVMMDGAACSARHRHVSVAGFFSVRSKPIRMMVRGSVPTTTGS